MNSKTQKSISMHSIAAAIVRDGFFFSFFNKTQGEHGAGICLFRIDIPPLRFSPLVFSSLAHQQKKKKDRSPPPCFLSLYLHPQVMTAKVLVLLSMTTSRGACLFLFPGKRKGKAGKTHEMKLGSGCWGCGTNWSWLGAHTGGRGNKRNLFCFLGLSREEFFFSFSTFDVVQAVRKDCGF